MSNFAKRAVARESIENDSVIEGLSNVETPEENLETQLAEMGSEDAALDQLMSDGDVLADDTDVVEAHVEMAEDAEENGEELSEPAAAAIEIAQESIRRRWCIDSPRVARESFRSGRGATAVARESWKDTLKQMWVRLMELIQAGIDRMHDLLLKVTNVGKSAVARAKKYEKVIDGLGAKVKDEISGGFITKLSIDGKFNLDTSIQTGRDFVAGGKIKAIMEAAKRAVDSAGEFAVAAGENGDVKLSDSKGDREFPAKVSAKIKELPGIESKEGTSYKVYALPGNNYVQSATVELAAGESKNTHTVTVFLSGGDASDDTNVTTPTMAQLRSANSALKSIGENYEKVVKDFRSQADAVKKLKDAIKKASDKFDKSKDENRDALRNARTAAQGSFSSAQAINKAVHTTVRNVISGTSGYIGAGAAAYKKK